MSTSVEPNNEDTTLRQRKVENSKSTVAEKYDEDKADLKRTKYDETKEFVDSLKKLETILAPILLTLLSFFVRFYRISKNNHVVWDEAHFGKFGSYYLRHEFYHDVHPPLGKMLVGLSGYLAGYNGSWDFPSGEEYPDYIDYTKMRLFNATFSALCVPFAYFTCKEIGFSIYATWLFSLMVCLESTYVTLGKFILLDSMLLFFTITTVFCFSRFNNFNNKNQEFSRKWWKWLILTGLSIGCTCSVKMVGLFVTALVGLYTIADLWNKLGDKSISWRKYIFGHWASRIFGLIVIPMSVFMLSFKVHFDLLYKSGTGDANMSPLFQANLVGSSVGGGPREVSIVHSSVTIKNQGLSGGLLHSHVQTFPSGSKQQQVTTYGHKDSNNNWVFQRARGVPHYDTANNNTDIEYIIDGMTIRLMHKNTGRNLHSHEVDAPVSKAQWEVAAYGNLTLGDVKDNWVVEIMEQNSNEDKMRIHPLTTSFRLRHTYLGCYLATSGSNLPQWGFRQGEVVCYKDPFKKDKRTWWIIEDNENPILPPPSEDFKLPKTKFIKDFIQLNLAMMATNNALVPDEEKQDDLASDFWQWPSLNVGIRMCGWGSKNPKYFMIGSPATTWTSTVGVFAFALLVIYYLVRWQRQIIDFPSTNPDKLKRFLMGGIYPMFGWGLHYVPFVIMGRVKYVHHYMPALYFAMLVFCYEVDSFSRRLNDKNASVASKLSYAALYLGLYALVGGTFYYFRYFSFGMEGPKEDWKHLQLLRSWRVADDNYR